MTITLNRSSRRAVLAGLGALAVSGKSQAQSVLPVLTTFSILADLVRQVGEKRVAVTSIVGPDGNAHAYTPTSGDARAFAHAKVIVLNGLGFEGWMDRMVDSSGTKASRVVASAGVKPMTRGQETDGTDRDHSGDVDPHAWQSVANARTYVSNIRAGLTKTDAGGSDDYTANAARYDARLAALDAEIRDRLGAVDAERKRVITSHAAFGYFAAAYGVTFLAPQGLSSDAEPSASSISRLITQIRESKASALFVENISDPRMIERIAKETGVKVGGTLYSDALTPPDGPAPTYERMMRHNLEQLVKGLSA